MFSREPPRNLAWKAAHVLRGLEELRFRAWDPGETRSDGSSGVERE